MPVLVAFPVSFPVRGAKAPSPPSTAVGEASKWLAVELPLKDADVVVDVELDMLADNTFATTYGCPVLEFRYQFCGASFRHSP